MPMSDEEYTRETARRMNALILDDRHREIVQAGLRTRLPIPETPWKEALPIQIFEIEETPDDENFSVTFLGMLNGLCGVRGGDGPFALWGNLVARYDDDHLTLLELFLHSEDPPR